jgi:hypothetical protein
MSVLNFLPNALAQGNPPHLFARVSARMAPPADWNSPLWVTFTDWKPNADFVINDWPAIHGITLPNPGAECCVVFDDQENLRCVWWKGVTVWPEGF